MSKSLMVSFSGIDSAGKSTYIDYLKSDLNKRGIKHKVIWSRGGYTPGFENLKKIIRFFMGKKLPKSGVSKKREEMFNDKKVSKLWYTIAMIDLIRLYAIDFRIMKFLGFTVICDRYIWDTYVDFKFQFPHDNFEKSFLWRVLVVTHKKPDVSLFFYVTPEESLKRSIDKKEMFAESLERREERLIIYKSLRNDKKWQFAINTQEKSIMETWEIVKKAIKNGI